MMTLPNKPFVLLDDAREGGAPARLYADPVRIIVATNPTEVVPALEEVCAAADARLHAAGFLSYEAAAALDPVLGDPVPATIPLLWFGLFEGFREIAPEDVIALLPDPAGAWNGAPEPMVDRATYNAQFAAVQAKIVGGDLYQANLTYRARLPVQGDPAALYARLRATSRAGFGALIDTGDATILSLSPELPLNLTGTPTISAMEAIAAIERAPRGLYTGAIGRLDADGGAVFNVAIRTLTWPHGATEAMLGAGGGIVADSVVGAEYDEARAKTDFLAPLARSFDLIETMAFDPERGIPLLDRHLQRLTASARAFAFTFDRHAARNELQAATFRLRTPRRVRLLLSYGGAIAIEVAPLPPAADGPISVAVVPLPVSPSDVRLRHKTSDRAFYDEARRLAGTEEVVFRRPDGHLTEGSFTSLFVPRQDDGNDGVLVTPPLAEGLLPGVLRAELLDSGRAVEGRLTEADLSHDFFVGNAVRGLMRARLAVAATPPER